MAFVTLKKGSKGDQVIQLQRWINLAAYLQSRDIKLADDGDFGSGTEKALKSVLGVTAVTEKIMLSMSKAVAGMKERAKLKKEGKTVPDAMLKGLVDQDQVIFQRLLEIYAIWEKSTPEFRSKNKVEFARAFDAAARLLKRFEKLTGSQQISITRGFPAEYLPLVQRYVKSRDGIGIAPIVIGVVAIAAIVIGGAATLAIQEWLTPAYKESTVDFKQTKEIQDILAKLPGNDKDTLIKEVEKQIDAAYESGVKKGSWSGFGSGLKTLGFVGAGAALYFMVVEPALENRKKRKTA